MAGKERPILFSGPMVRAILDGKKTQTRRIVDGRAHNKWVVLESRDDDPWPFIETADGRRPIRCPYGHPGDRLWVRETWQPGYTHVSVSSGGADVSTCEVIYREGNVSLKRPAPDDVAEKWDRLYSEDGPDDPVWRPSIFMPRWASRLTLEVVSVRVERLQEIGEQDAEAEAANEFPVGIQYPDGRRETAIYHRMAESARNAFMRGWDSLNGKRAPWESNPWVWVVTFKTEEKPHG